MTNQPQPAINNEEISEQLSEKMNDLQLQAKEREAQILAQERGVQYIYLKGMPISPEALMLIPEELARDLNAVCFFYGSSAIRIGALNPLDSAVREKADQLKKELSADVRIYQISEHSLELAFRLFGTLPKIRKVVRGVEIKPEEIERFEKEIVTFQDLEKQLKKVSITDMLALIIAAALKARSSDIHIEAEEHHIQIRFRIDGILNDVAKINKEDWPRVISRVKLVSRLKINVADRPQDGRFTIFMTDDKIDVRVSCLPTSFGESVVMRLLRSSVTGLNFEDLGLRGRAYEILKEEIEKPNGMIITTGPTGSGKTTTLYGVLNKLNNSENKIITIEDPIEYKVEGINQSQVDHARGYDFANGLRSILRQDPDIVMVGEIRDFETAEIAINAALTGHLVVSTLHTNDAAGTIPRLLAMGVKPFLLAPSINAMIGQRLVRKICPYCKIPAELDSNTMSRVMTTLSEIPENSGSRVPEAELKQLKFYKGSGCEQCQGLGYKGRVGVFEVIVMRKEIEDMILSGHVSEYDMRLVSKKHGVLTMIQDGLLKAIDGITTVEEVFRVAKDIDSRL